MLTSLLAIFIDVFSAYVIHMFVKKYLGVKLKKWWQLLLLWTVTVLALNVLGSLWEEYPIANLIAFIAAIFIVLIIGYGGTLKQTIVYDLIIYITGMFCEVIAFLLVISWLHVDYKTASQFGVGMQVAAALSRLIWFIIIKLISNIIAKKKNMDIKANDWIEAFVVPIASVVALLSLVSNPYERLNVNILIAIVMFFIINLSTFYLYTKISKYTEIKMEKKFLAEQSQYYLEQCKEVEKLWLNMSAFRHDIKNRYILEKTYLDEGKYEELAKEYENIIGALKSERNNANTGNIFVDAIVNYKASICEENGISFSSSLNLPSSLDVDDTDLSILLGNLLDNAIEANKKIESEKYIYLKINFDNDRLFIYVENPFNGEVKKSILNEYQSTKEDHINHGIGLKVIKSVFEKYEGQIDIDATEDKFIVRGNMYIELI